MPRVNVPGRGIVNFPDTMSQAQILEAIRKLSGGPPPTAGPAETKTATSAAKSDEGGGFTRMAGAAARQIVSPIEPVKRLAQKTASAIEGVERPSQGGGLIEAAKEAVKSPGSAARAGLELTGIPSVVRLAAFPYQEVAATIKDPSRFAPVQQTRAMLAGVVEGIGSLSPLEGAMLAGGRRFGRGRAARASRVRPETPIPVTREPVPASELADMAQQISRALQKNLDEPRDLGPSLRRSAAPGQSGAAGGPSPGARPRLVRRPDRINVESVVQEALRELGGPERPAQISLPPAEAAPMPRTGGRESAYPGRTIPEPGGALGLGEDSAAAAIKAGQRRAVQRQSAEREIDRQAERALQQAMKEATARTRGLKQGAAEPKIELPVPQSIIGKAYEAGATPAEAAGVRTAEKAMETAAAGKVVLPKLPKLQPPKSSNAPEPRATVATEMKADTRRRGLLGALKKFKSEDAALTKKVTRAAYLAEIEKPSTGQITEMAKLQRDILAHPKFPQALKSRWQNTNAAVEASQRPSTKRTSTVERSKAIADEIRPPASIPKREPIPVSDIAAAREQVITGRISESAAPPPGVPGLLEQSRQALPLVDEAIRSTTPEGPVPNPRLLKQEIGTPRPGGALPGELESLRSVFEGVIPPPQKQLLAPPGFELPNRFIAKRAKGLDAQRQIRTRIMAPAKPKLKPEADAPAVRSVSEIASTGPVAPKTGSKIFERVQAIQAKKAAERAAQPEPVPALAPAAEAPAPSAPVRSVEESIGPPPKGVEPDQWTSINALESEFARQADRGVRDIRIMDEMRRFWGSDEAARRLGVSKDDLVNLTGATTKKRPLRAIIDEMDQRYQYLVDDPSGFLRTEALLAGTGAAAGALAGATIEGEDAVDRLAFALSGAAIGGGLGLAGAKGVQAALRAAKPVKGKTGPLTGAGNAVEIIDSANLLAGPAAFKASFGSMGGVAAGLWQRFQEGRIGEVRAGLRSIRREAPQLWWNTLKGPTSNLGKGSAYTSHVAKQARLPQMAEKVLLNVLRPFIAADRAGKVALKRMGFSEAESDRLMLLGEPVTWQGQTFLNTINSHMALRLFAKFPRVRIGGLERGVEFTPFLSKKFGQSMRHRKSPQGRFAPQEPINAKALRARAQFGGGMMLAGTAYGYLQDPSLAEGALVSSMAGPAAVPAAASIAAGKALRSGGDPQDLAMRALEVVVGSIPSISESDVRMLPDRLKPLSPLMRALRAAGLVEE